MKKTILSISLASFILISCSKSNEVTEGASPPATTGGGTTTTCDTVNMKYAANVKPILAANCYSCHGNGNAQSGVTLDTYEKVKQQADKGNLVAVITHASGYPAMPYNKPKLSDCDINKIKDWIARGTNNN